VLLTASKSYFMTLTLLFRTILIVILKESKKQKEKKVISYLK